ncbi:MAG: hypothetical protein J07HX64_01791 [halophilic archaeon J07HX64]|nr:MAG: hypothetical protein J07HX64_01791 [halophilic archaeon J07HX64]
MANEKNHLVAAWSTKTELVREFDRPADVVDAVSRTADEAVRRWSELSETPSLSQFVDIDGLDGLFKPKATDHAEWIPSVEFQFQSCRVTLLYGSSIRIIVERDV